MPARGFSAGVLCFRNRARGWVWTPQQSSAQSKLERGMRSQCALFQASSVTPSGAGFAPEGHGGRARRDGPGVLSWHQFRCLLAETGTGMHILGKGLLVISEDWFDHCCNATSYRDLCKKPIPPTSSKGCPLPPSPPCLPGGVYPPFVVL